MSEYPTFEEMNNKFLLASKKLNDIPKNSSKSVKIIKDYFSEIKEIQTKIDTIPENARSLALNLLKSMIDVNLTSLASVLKDNQELENLLTLEQSIKVNSSNIDKINNGFADIILKISKKLNKNIEIKVPVTKIFWIIEEMKIAFKELLLDEGPVIEYSTERITGVATIDDFTVNIYYDLLATECNILINAKKVITEQSDDIYELLQKAIQTNRDLDLRIKVHKVYRKGIK